MMAEIESRQLRGYDSFRVSLGDEMRGERASMGKSLLDVQRELRIKAAHIDAIENSDPEGIPFRGFVTGYVRAYARYLGMDEDVVLRRFCDESGFEPGATVAKPAAARSTRARSDDLDAVIAGSKLAAAARSASVNADMGATVRGLASLSVMIALVGGLGYGGWAVLQNIQRVEFAPLPEAPEAMVRLPEFDSMTRVARASVAPSIDAEALAALYAAQEAPPPRIAPRDGPIAALDPDRGGVYAAVASRGTGARLDAPTVPIDPAFAAALASAAPEDAPAATATSEPSGVVLVADAEAWVRVRDGSGEIVHEALMRPGQRWRAPVGAAGYTLRAGNAGGLFLEVGGTRFGPLGRPGAVVSNILMDAESVRAAFADVARTAEAAVGPERVAESAAIARP